MTTHIMHTKHNPGDARVVIQDNVGIVSHRAEGGLESFPGISLALSKQGESLYVLLEQGEVVKLVSQLNAWLLMRQIKSD